MELSYKIVFVKYIRFFFFHVTAIIGMICTFPIHQMNLFFFGCMFFSKYLGNPGIIGDDVLKPQQHFIVLVINGVQIHHKIKFGQFFGMMVDIKNGIGIDYLVGGLDGIDEFLNSNTIGCEHFLVFVHVRNNNS